MFKFAEKREVLWPVTISVPSKDGDGSIDEHVVKVRFELLSRTDAQAIQDDPETGNDVLPARIKGWSDIFDEDGNPIEFSPGNLAALLDVPYIERAFSIGLLQASNGAPAKNFKAGSGG